MILLEWDGHSAIYLDHKVIINKAYSTNVNNSSTYQLKSHLFNYKPKPTTTDVTSPKARKRKFRKTNISAETADLRTICSGLVTELKQSAGDRFTDGQNESTILERIWEEATVFPQFKGLNPTNRFEHFTLNNKEYVIPPVCQFFNHDLLKLTEISQNFEKFDFVVVDPPWRNKYIRRVKKFKQELGYKMIHNDFIPDIPINTLIHCESIVALWCTNSPQHQQVLLEEFLPRWDLNLISKIMWLKLNTEGNLIGEINDDGKKQPYEVLFLAVHRDSRKDHKELKNIEFLLSIPSIIHSHKPPILEVVRSSLPENPKCLELFARYLQPGFTSIGLEVIKLMDVRLYCHEGTKINVK